MTMQRQTDLCSHCIKVETVPSVPLPGPRWRHRFPRIPHRTKPADIRCIIIKGNRELFPGDTNIPEVLKESNRIGWFQVPKDTYRTIDCGKRRSTEENVKQTELYRRAVDAKTYRVLLTHRNTLWKIEVRSCARTRRSCTRQLSARTRQAAYNLSETVCAHAPLMLAHDRRVLTYHWKNDYNHELLNYWRGQDHATRYQSKHPRRASTI
jgi:hypothetical protein